MTPEDLHILCTALGFTAVVTQKNAAETDRSYHALALASLIESFCRHTIPDLSLEITREDIRRLDKAIEGFKADLRIKGEADMQKGRADLLQLYDRLRQRFLSYASDDMIADRVLELLDVELKHNVTSGN